MKIRPLAVALLQKVIAAGGSLRATVVGLPLLTWEGTPQILDIWRELPQGLTQGPRA
jgi:hypothetical protein